MGDTLTEGQRLEKGGSLTSKNGAYTLTLQDDGNLVLAARGNAVWATGTDEQDVVRAEVQTDGNFVLYTSDKPVWHTETCGEKNVRLVLQDDRNLVLYAASGPAWSSETVTDAAPPPAPEAAAPEVAPAGQKKMQTSSQLDQGSCPYTVLRRTYDPPQRDDLRYVHLADQTLDVRDFNGFRRVVRRVTVSGVSLVLDEADASGLLKATRGSDDVAEVFFVADSVTVRTGLTFPGANVHMYARAVSFAGPEACIDTSAPPNTYRDPTTSDGLDGLPAGDIDLVCATFSSDTSGALNLRAVGGAGQEADEGGLIPGTGSRRDIPEVTQADWDALMSPSNRRLPHEEVLWDKYGYTSTMPYTPMSSIYQGVTPGAVITYAEINNSYWRDNVHLNVSDREVISQVGSKELPGVGADSAPPGRPGSGGAGGRLRTSVDGPQRYCTLAGGRSGPRHAGSPGGPGGTPAAPVWVFFEGRPDGGDHKIRTRTEAPSPAQPGKPSDPGPAPLLESGADGVIERVEGTASSGWVNAVALGAVVQFAQDLLAANQWPLAARLLAPYAGLLGLDDDQPSVNEDTVAALAEATPPALGDGGALATSAVQVARMLSAASSFLDEYGKPVGWVPSVTLESALAVYNSVLDGAMNQLALSFALQRAWDQESKRAQRLDTMIESLMAASEQARQAMVSARDALVKRSEGKDSPLTEMVSLLQQATEQDAALDKRRTELLEEADKQQVAQDQKQAIADGFKLAGAMLKALPLPEPVQTAVGAVGTLSDVTSSFIETGGSETAFENLKSSLTSFADRDDLTEVFSSDLNSAIGANDAQSSELTKKAKQVADRTESLKASRATQLSAHQVKLDAAKKRSSKLAAHRQAQRWSKTPPTDLANLQNELTKATTEFDAADQVEATAATDLNQRQANLTSDREALDQLKTRRAAGVKAAMSKVQKLAEGAAEISQTINKMMVYQSTLDTRWDATLARVVGHDAEFRQIKNQLDSLNKRKGLVAASIQRLQDEIQDSADTITRNAQTLVELRAQYANTRDSLDPQAITYLRAVQQDAFKALSQFLYYVVKAYEYYVVEPWQDSQYTQATKMFQTLGTLLAKTQDAAATTLNPADLARLRTVYELPLQAMGRALADSLMTGRTGRQQVITDTFTLRSHILARVNRGISDPQAQPETLFNPAALGWLDGGKERQRLRRIKIVGVEGRPVHRGAFPDTVAFTFVHRGRSLVRADGSLYAFDPSDGSNSRPYRPNNTWETRASSGASAWTPSQNSPDICVLDPAALTFAAPGDEGNLLTMLLGNKGQNAASSAELSKLSSFRPGCFSDLELVVSFKPTGAHVEFTKILVEVTQEVVDCPSEALVVVDNDAGLKIPVQFSRADVGAHTSGEGLVFGIFDRQALAHQPVTITVPATFGEHAFTGWTVDGRSAPAGAVNGNRLTVDQSCDVQALYNSQVL
jgi:hypothetical protein